MGTHGRPGEKGQKGFDGFEGLPGERVSSIHALPISPDDQLEAKLPIPLVLSQGMLILVNDKNMAVFSAGQKTRSQNSQFMSCLLIALVARGGEYHEDEFRLELFCWYYLFTSELLCLEQTCAFKIVDFLLLLNNWMRLTQTVWSYSLSSLLCITLACWT